MYKLVEFTASEEINLVSASWMEGEHITWWPNYGRDDQITRAIKNHDHIGPGRQKYHVRVLYTTGKDPILPNLTKLCTDIYI